MLTFLFPILIQSKGYSTVTNEDEPASEVYPSTSFARATHPSHQLPTSEASHLRDPGDSYINRIMDKIKLEEVRC